jgi:2-methylcitrate dehydratase PrpD
MVTVPRISGSVLSASEASAGFCASLRYDALPPIAIERVKDFFIDHLGIALGASTLDSSQPVRRLAAARPIPGGATLLGRPDPVSAQWAAFANGMAAHSMELDDTFLPGSIHNESFVFSPSLALAESGARRGGQRRR